VRRRGQGALFEAAHVLLTRAAKRSVAKAWGVRLAHARLDGRAEVRRMCFEDMAWCEEFDGIWACASLLHVSAAEFPSIAARFAATLAPKGPRRDTIPTATPP
jgi:hypothetical protein